MSNYILSIIIPTKNRQFYCMKAIEEVINNTSNDVQLVIQDNSNDPHILSSFVSKLNNNRILYHHQKNVLSFVDNFSEAVSFSSGEYLCMIGDDDGVLKSIESAVIYAKNNDIDCYIPSQNAVYIWPNEKPIVPKAENGYLCLSYLHNRIVNVDTKKSLRMLLKQGFQDYQHLSVPRLYHGLVKREILDSIKAKTGRFFGGLTPDMYMIVALSLMCKKVVFSKMPITISGICPQSGSSASATGKHTGKLAEAPHFIGQNNYIWSELVPAIYTVETIWADTGVHALLDFHQNELIKQFNKKRLLIYLIDKYPQFKNEYDLYQKKNVRINPLNICFFKILKSFLFIKKVFARIFRKKTDVIKHYGIQNIEEAAFIVDQVCSKIK